MKMMKSKGPKTNLSIFNFDALLIIKLNLIMIFTRVYGLVTPKHLKNTQKKLLSHQNTPKNFRVFFFFGVIFMTFSKINEFGHTIRYFYHTILLFSTPKLCFIILLVKLTIVSNFIQVQKKIV